MLFKFGKFIKGENIFKISLFLKIKMFKKISSFFQRFKLCFFKDLNYVFLLQIIRPLTHFVSCVLEVMCLVWCGVMFLF